MFYDEGTTGTVDNRWKNQSGANGSATSTSEGTTFSNSDTIRYDMFVKNSSNQIYIWNAPFCIEYDLVAITGTTSRLQVYSSETTDAYNGGASVGHWKITYDGTTLQPYFNGTLTASYERDFRNARIGFYIVTGESMTFKNFKIYPI